MVGIELVLDRQTKQHYPMHNEVGRQVALEARKRGVILRPLGDVIVLLPPLSISMDEIGLLLDAAYWSIAKVTGGRVDFE